MGKITEWCKGVYKSLAEDKSDPDNSLKESTRKPKDDFQRVGNSGNGINKEEESDITRFVHNNPHVQSSIDENHEIHEYGKKEKIPSMCFDLNDVYTNRISGNGKEFKLSQDVSPPEISILGGSKLETRLLQTKNEDYKDLYDFKNSDFDIVFFQTPTNRDVVMKKASIHLGKCLGEGAFGAVFRVKFLDNIEGDFALKVFKVPENVSGQKERGSCHFAKEFELLTGFDSIHIVKIRGKLISNFYSGYLMDQHPQSLYDVLHKCEKLPIELFCQYSIGMVKGLIALSEKNISHNDLKPMNILVSKNDQIVFCDFGASSRKEKTDNSSQYIGTAFYNSPERSSKGVYNLKSDIYSVGVILFEMFVGSKKINEIREKMEESHSLSNYLSEIDDPKGILKPLIEKCLRFKMKERPDARTILKELQRYQNAILLE